MSDDVIPTANSKYWRGRVFRVPKGYEMAGPLSMARLGEEFLSIPKRTVPALVEKYLDELETGKTEDWCQCKWHIHPDDTEIKAGHCRNCNHPNATHKPEPDQYGNTNYPCTLEESEDECPCMNYQGRRQRRIDDEPLCPVHSKLGLILGFYEWLFPKEEEKPTHSECVDHD